MGVLFPLSEMSLAETEQSLLFIAITAITYSTFILIRGLHSYKDPDFIGVLMGGFAGRLPRSCHKNVPKRMAALIINAPGIVLPWMTYMGHMRFPHSNINNIIFILFLSYYVKRLVIGMLMSGYTINIGDVLIEFAFNFSFAYGQSAALCYLYEYGGVMDVPFYAAGVLMYLIGFVIYLFHEYKLRNLEVMFQTRIPYARGGMFELVVAPQHLGEIMMVGGMALATQTICGIAHAVFLTAHYMILSNMRYADLSDRLGGDFNRRVKRLFPFVW